MIQRSPDWPTILHTFLADRRDRRFRWGQNDCILFALDCVRAITGADMAADIRGKYDSAASARDLIKTYGGDLADAADAFALRFEVEEVPARYAQRGDLAIVESPVVGQSLAVVMPSYIVAPARRGTLRTPRYRALKTWAIGRSA